MKLLLTSSGISNPSIKQSLRTLLGKSFQASHVTFIPTAANIEQGDKGWLVDDMMNVKNCGFATFDVIDIAAVGEKYWRPSFKKADVLVFGGGNTKYLREWIKKSGVEDVLPTFLKTKVYVGISAGSMVTAKKISLTYADMLYYEETGSFQDIEGLGFVDFEIRPHLNSRYFTKLTVPILEKIAAKTQRTFYGIDDNTAIQVIDGNIEVVTEGSWKKFN